MSKTTNLKKNERRAFWDGGRWTESKPMATQRDRTERRRQSWIADADNDRHTEALKIFRRRL